MATISGRRINSSPRIRSHELTSDGKPIGAARDGDGKDLTLPSDALQATTQFIVSVTRLAEAGIPVTRTAVIDVTAA